MECLVLLSETLKMQGPKDQGEYSIAAQPKSQDAAKSILQALDAGSIEMLQMSLRLGS